MKKRYRTEALASFFVVGLGQILKGEGDKGLKLILIFYFIFPGLTYLSLSLNAHLFILVFSFSLIASLLIWLYNIWEAYNHETLV